MKTEELKCMCVNDLILKLQSLPNDCNTLPILVRCGTKMRKNYKPQNVSIVYNDYCQKCVLIS